MLSRSFCLAITAHAATIQCGPAKEQQLCDVGEFLCHDYATCVSQNWLCDGEPDCPDDSDESLDTCPEEIEFKCPLNHITCIGTNRCIHLSQLCNGAYDCSDGYDEGVHCRELAILRKAKRDTSRKRSMDFNNADFNKLMELVGQVYWEGILRDKRVQKNCQLLKGTTI
ncbi:hypothetical protein Y1Q_0011659 [Alligator mississippiensis]|uniref:Uncharacterized protein n=1 Tax=Alligator mississippiensis TaxID=8496 RepID=A0A151M0P9_ALLMI|nr:hypothetical protein Y1Q_0011659 [Alligator mississippiensis]